MANFTQRSFASGELAPALYARTDLAKYLTGLRTCRNFIVQRTGGANLRPGTEFVGETVGSGVVRLIKFVFSNSQAYVMEFGAGYIRFYQNGGLVLSGGLPVSVTTPYTVDDLPDLRYVQSLDVVTVVHPSYAPQELRRLSATSWTFGPVTFGAAIAAPTGLVRSGGTPTVVGTLAWWRVTAIDEVTGEESLASDPDYTLLVAGEPNATFPQNITWSAVTGARSYNIYRGYGGATPDGPAMESYGLIGTSTVTGFVDSGQVPDYTMTPPQAFTGFAATDDYPSLTGFYQQRQLYAASNNAPERVWCSQTGLFKNFNTSFPLQDDDAITFQLANAELSTVRHLLDLGKLVVGTDGTEWLIEGDQNSGVLTPFSINPRAGSYNGSATLQPVKVGNSVLYVQALGNKVLELRTNIYQGYYVFTGRDLSVYSTHLFDGYTLAAWDYAQIPNYLTLAVRDDGTLLAFTYLADEELSAWHRHDTDGAFEDVCVIPEGREHRIYVVVRRTIGQQTKRYIERFRPLVLSSIDDACFMDAALEYDGRDAGAAGATITLTGSGWAPGDPLTATGSSATEFSGAQTGDARFLRNADGTQVVATVQTVLSGTQATVFVDIDVPADMQGVAITDWDRAVKTVGNLGHLEAKAISIFADQQVVASPNNPEVTQVVVTGALATLDQAYAHIWAGLPYLGDLETLDIDTPQGASLKESKLEITSVGMWVQASRGIFMGRQAPASGAAATSGLHELKIRSPYQTPGDPNPLLTQYVEAPIDGEWSLGGRVFVRQVDPVPLNVLSVTPLGFLPENG